MGNGRSKAWRMRGGEAEKEISLDEAALIEGRLRVSLPLGDEGEEADDDGAFRSLHIHCSVASRKRGCRAYFSARACAGTGRPAASLMMIPSPLPCLVRLLTPIARQVLTRPASRGGRVLCR